MIIIMYFSLSPIPIKKFTWACKRSIILAYTVRQCGNSESDIAGHSFAASSLIIIIIINTGKRHSV